VAGGPAALGHAPTLPVVVRDVGRTDSPLPIRQATAADLLSLQRVEVLAAERFNELGMSEIAAHPPTDLAELRAGLAAGLLWLAEDLETGVVAFALAERLVGSLHLQELSVLPSHARRGLGTALVECVAETAATQGCSRLTLSTFSDVPWNGPFYERLGFRAVAVADLAPELQAVRRGEAELGLRIEERVIMSRALGRP